MPADTAVPISPQTLSYASHPGVLSRLLAELGGAGTVSKEAAALVMWDPALLLRVLEAVGQLHPGTRLADLDFAQAVTKLGPVTLKSLAIASAAEQLAIPDFSPEELENAWRKALATAHLARMLAERSGYTGPDEAWIAGLLCWLPAFARLGAGEGNRARQPVLAALERLPWRSFLADVMRYLHEPAQRLMDAAPLVRLTVAAYRQITSYPPWNPSLPHPDTLILAAPLDEDDIDALYTDAAQAIEVHTSKAGPWRQSELARNLSRMSRLELVSAVSPDDSDAAVHSLADSLASQEGLGHALYLRLNSKNGRLESQPLGGQTTATLSIQPRESTTAAAWALLTREPVVVTLDAPDDAAILDLQLIRQAGADGLVALPIGAEEPVGVLVVCGSRQALAAVGANPHHYRRLGEIAGRQPAPKPDAASVDADQWMTRIRRASHEINNPLGIVKNYLAIMKAKLGETAPIGEELRIVHEELDRIVRILRGLANPENGLAPLLKPADVNALIRDLVKVTEPSWLDKGARIALQLDDSLPPLACDQDKLKQIILNLLINALEASPAGGTVRLETAYPSNDKQERFLEIVVADSGHGVPQELSGRLFTPVESKKGGGHAGIGLSIVKALTQAMNGTITYTSNTLGTTFRVLLPAA